jgi:ribokinase
VVGYDWPLEYTEALSRSAIDTAGLITKDAETLRAWTIYELSGYRRYFSRNTEVVLLTPSPFRSSPLAADEAVAYSEAARRVHLRNSPLPQDLPADLWNNIDSIHICPMRLETILIWIDFLQHRPDIFVSVDILPYPLQGNLDDPDLRRLLNRVDAFMPSETEAEGLMPGYDVEAFCREFAGRGPKIVLVKLGDHGAAGYDRKRDLFFEIPPYPADVSDLTGAGDSFCGGFTIGFLETRDVVQAALYGTVSASIVIEGFGGLHALEISRDQTEARLAGIKRLNIPTVG